MVCFVPLCLHRVFNGCEWFENKNGEREREKALSLVTCFQVLFYQGSLYSQCLSDTPINW